MEGSQTTTLATATTEIRQKPKEPAEAELGSEVAFDTANSGLGLAIQGSQTEVQVQYVAPMKFLVPAGFFHLTKCCAGRVETTTVSTRNAYKPEML